MVPMQSGVFTRAIQDVRRDLRLNRSVTISHLRVSNGVFLAVIGPSTLLKLSVVQNEKPTEITVLGAPLDLSPSYMHMCPQGRNVIVAYPDHKNFYINLETNACVELKRIKKAISAVAWGEVSKKGDAGLIIVGTVKGKLYEAAITTAGTLTHCKELTCAKLLAQPICELSLHLLSENDESSPRTLCLLCQPTQILAINGSVDMANIQQVFRVSAQNSFVPAASFTSAWPVAMQQTELKVCIYANLFASEIVSSIETDRPESPEDILHIPSKAFLAVYPHDGEPQRFAWLFKSTCIFGHVDINPDNSRVLVKERTIQLPMTEGKREEAVGVSLSQWHAIFALPSRVIATSVHTHAVAFDDREVGTIRGLVPDTSAEFHWAFSDAHTIKYKPYDEARYVWRILLDRGDFAKAQAVAQERKCTDPTAYELVLRKQSEVSIKEKNFIAAAEVLAHSSEPFESIVLRFLSTEDDRRDGLKTLLEKKLKGLSKSDSRIKQDILIMWLLDVQLQEIAERRRSTVKADKRWKELSKQLHAFCKRQLVYEFMLDNKDAVFKLISSHADFDTQLFVAKHLKGLSNLTQLDLSDYERVLDVYILQEQYASALNLLTEQKSPDLYLKYASTMIAKAPHDFLQSLIGFSKVQPSKLLPLLAQCQDDEAQANEVLAYLEWAVKATHSSNKTHHNLLITMLAKYKPAELKAHLESLGKNKALLPYDLELATRTCQQYDLRECIVFLYCIDDLFIEAIDMALTIDIELAKKCAKWMQSADDDAFFDRFVPDELIRRAWLNIASHVINTKCDANAAIAILKESGDVIKIQDILPFFPDFTKMTEFKEPLIECLKEHSHKIQELQERMKQSTQTAAEIREKTEKITKRVTVVRAGENCSHCKKMLVSRPFFAFACRHFFHRDCLETVVEPMLDPKYKEKLRNLVHVELRLLQTLDAEERVGNAGSAHAQKSEKLLRRVSKDIADILGDDCPLCGLRAINLLDKPLFTEEEYERELNAWSLDIPVLAN